jgi:lipopolysaccharide export system permease protein
MLGISVYLLDQVFSNLGLLWRLNPALTALLPGVMLIALANVWLRRVF